jgi:2-polyprenyl-6-methoxyphenol hydroxylase-like FAD-dependent oxidoreductase
MSKRLGQQAVVVGGSIAGLLTARVLSEHFDEVTVLERDDVEDRPVLHKSVPQGHHLHGLLQGGLHVLSALYPSFADDLRLLGATRITIGRDIVWHLPDGKAYTPSGSVRAPYECGLEGYCASRALIEFAIRRRTAAITNVRVEYGSAVRELVCHEDRVRGVRCADSRLVEADLVIDATGRGTRARQWLASIGYTPPEETEVGLDTAYSTATFRRPKSFSGEPIIFITGPAPHFTRRGYVPLIRHRALRTHGRACRVSVSSKELTAFRDAVWMARKAAERMARAERLAGKAAAREKSLAAVGRRAEQQRRRHLAAGAAASNAADVLDAFPVEKGTP